VLKYTNEVYSNVDQKGSQVYTTMDALQIESTSNAEKDPLAIWTGFYKKTLAERQDQLKLLYPQIEDRKNLPLSVSEK